MKIVADAQIPYLQDYFSSHGDLVLIPGRQITRRDVLDADILLVRSITHVDENLLSGSRVKFVGSVTAGADHLDTQWLDGAGIAWSVAAAFNAPPVADYVVSVIAALQQKKLLTRKQAKIAVIGVGNVGRLVVERLRQLHFEVILCDPLRAQNENNFISTPLQDIRDVDAISLHVPLIKSGDHATFHFIDQDFLQRQKPDCVLINASRGAVINSDALLQDGRHLHWCLDVWEHEPKIRKDILGHALIATPHIAGYSVQSKIRGIQIIYQIACARKIISEGVAAHRDMPTQVLDFPEHALDWQTVVLSVFNPLAMTEEMQGLLKPAVEYASLFDEIRHEFNYRYEFAYTQVKGARLAPEDVRILKALGMKV